MFQVVIKGHAARVGTRASGTWVMSIPKEVANSLKSSCRLLASSFAGQYAVIRLESASVRNFNPNENSPWGSTMWPGSRLR